MQKVSDTGEVRGSRKRGASIARFGSLSFINEQYKLASEVLAGNEKLFKQAFFNAAANIFVLLAILASIAVFFILEVFLRPLLWATLTGSFLYPFKKAATGAVQGWLKGLTQSGTPLFIGLLLLPFHLINYLSDLIGIFISNKFYLFLIAFLSYPLLYVLFAWTPIKFMFRAIAWVFRSAFQIHGFLANSWCRFVAPYFWTLYIAYFIVAFIYSSKENSASLKKLSIFVWCLMVYHVIETSSGFVVISILLLSCVALFGYLQHALKASSKKKVQIDDVPLLHSKDSTSFDDRSPLASRAGVTDGGDEPVADEVNDPVVNQSHDQNSSNSSLSTQDNGVSLSEVVQNTAVWLRRYARRVFEADAPSSDSEIKRKSNLAVNFNDLIVSFCFYGLGWSILMIQTIKHLWILPMFFIPVTLFVLKRSFFLFGIDTILHPYLKIAKDKLKQSQDVLMPGCVHQLVHFYLVGDKKVIKMLKGSIGVIVSILLVSLLLLGSIVLSFLLAAQIQEEGMAIVDIGTTLAQEMAASYPQFKSVLPNSTSIQSSLTMAVERAYDHSRGLIQDWVISYLGESDTARSQEITDQLLAVYDQIYLQLWVNRNQTSNQSIAEVFSTMKNLYTDNQPEDNEDDEGFSLLNGQGILKAFKTHGSDLFHSGYDMIHGNFDTLRSVSMSIWSILHSNLNLVFSILTSLIWIVLSSGSQIMNFLISFVVFLTALFYLLSLSGNRYKPMEFIASIMPANPMAMSDSTSSTQNTFAEAVNSAVMGVFGASLKLSAFYGLLTYVTHTIAGVRLVFLPAAVAAMLGAVPVFGTYLACIPAVLELWLLHDELVGALILLVAHLLPTYGGFDAAIYAQITGAGHPYLTGLAVVGGISVRGLEGAILGPILLCVLIVVSNVYSSVIATNTSETGTYPNSSSVSADFAFNESVEKSTVKSYRSQSVAGIDAAEMLSHE